MQSRKHRSQSQAVRDLRVTAPPHAQEQGREPGSKCPNGTLECWEVMDVTKVGEVRKIKAKRNSKEKRCREKDVYTQGDNKCR